MPARSVIRRHEAFKVKGSRMVLPAYHPASQAGRSIFPTRVFNVDEVQRVLKSGHQSRKIGKVVTKGPRRGWPLFTLTLEERNTCPRNCKAWAFCMGNNMQFAERIVAGPELEAALWSELEALQQAHPRGFLVRLHILGDFYSVGYVGLWRSALDAFPALHVFGFTAHLPASEIGAAVMELTQDWERFAVRFSGLPDALFGSILEGHEGFEDAILCPAQTGATDCCASCSLCWASKRSIGFRRH